MAPLTVDLNTLKERVVTELEHNPRRPTQLLDLLGEGYSDTLIKEAVLRLLQEGRIAMTASRELRVVG
jgi:hypothetical protein